MTKGWFRDLLIPMKPTESAPPATSRETFFFLPLLRLYLIFFPLFCLDYFLPFDLRAIVLNGYGCYLILPAFDELLRTTVPTSLRIGSYINFRILELLFSLSSPRRYITSFDPPPFVLHGLLFSYFCLIRLSLHLSVQVLKIIYPFMKPLLKTLAIYLENKSNCSVPLGQVAQTVLCHTSVSGSHQCVVEKEFGAPHSRVLEALNNFLKNKGIISDLLKSGRAKNREEKPLVDFDATNNRACQSGLLVSNSEETTAREASKGPRMTEGTLSVVDPMTRISSTDFDAPENGARLMRANQRGPITLNSEEKDTSEGLIGECLDESVLSLDDSTKRKSFPDFDATEIKAHLVSAYQSGPVVSLSENKNEGEALKRECITKSILGLEDLQQHCGGRPDANSKSFRAIYDPGLHTTDSLTRKSFQVLETLRPREQQSNATDTDQERQIQTQMCHELSDACGAHRIHLDTYIGRFWTHICPSLCHSVCIRSIFGEQSNDLVPLLSLRRLTLKGCVRQDKSPCFPRLLQINAVDKGLTQSPRYSGGLTAQSASSSRWPISLQDGAHIVLLDPLKQSAKNVPHAARQDQCSLTVSLREKKMVRRTLKRKYRTICVIFEYHQQYFGRRCEGAAKSFGATRNCRKHGIRQVSTVKCIHKQHWIHRWPFRQKRATRNGYSLRDERPFGASKLSMDEKLDSRLLFIHMSQFARSSPQPLDLLHGGVIVGPIALSSSEFAAANNRAHFVRQDQSSSTASCREGKSARETLHRQGITMSLCIVGDLQQHFGSKHKDAMKGLGVNISMFNSTCRLHQFCWRPCWNEKNEQVFDARNNRTHLAKADQSGPTMSNSKKENTREALKREYVTSRVLRHLVRQRTLTHKHCVRRKQSQDLPQSLQMDCSGGLATQKSTRSLHWPLGLPDGGPIVTHSEKKIVRNTFKRKCRSMSVSFEDHQQHFCSRCEGAANSLGAKRNCKRHGINLVSTAKRIHRQHGIHRCQFRQGYSLGGERPAEVISLSMDEKLVLRLQFLHMSWLAGSSLHPFALRSGREIVGYIAFSSSEFAATNNRAHPGRQDRCGSSASCPENERTKETNNREGTASRIISREVLEQHFGRKREDVAKMLGYSVSTFKRVCRDHGIPRWPNRRSNYVRRPPDPHGEKNPSPTVNTLSTNAQITMEMGGQNSEPNECLPDSLLGHCHDADICFPAVYSETDAAGGSSKWAFPLEGQTTQSTASPNRNALVFPQSQMASTKVLYQNIGSAEDRRDLFASQEEAYLEGHVSDETVATILHTIPHLTGGSSELMFQQKNQSMQFAAYPNPNGLVDPYPHMALTQKISENMRSLDDRRNLLAPQKEPLPEGHVSGSVNWTVGSCSSLAPSQPMPTIPHTTGSSEHWRNSLDFVEGHLMGENLHESFNLTVPPCSDPASQPMPTIHHTMATIPHMMPLLTERPDTRSVKLKAIYGDTTIKFPLPLTSGINELKEEVSKILECKLGSFNVEYKDEDGDWILMASDENVSEYLQLLTSLGNQVTKLKLRDKVPNTTNFCDNCGCHNCRSLKQKRPQVCLVAK